MAVNGKGRSTSKGGTVDAQLLRPYVVALLEAQPLPVVMYHSAGEGMLHNSKAAHLLAPSSAAPRLVADDGTDLWTIIAGRGSEASPLLDVRVRLRVDGGQTLETMMSVLPMRGASGVLDGAMAFALSSPGERVRSAEPLVEQVSQDEFGGLVTQVAALLGADRVTLLELDRGYSPEARLLARWPHDSHGPEEGVTFSIRGTPVDGFGGRRILCIPRGVAEKYTNCGGGDECYEGYAGVALTDPDGEQVGVLSAMWKEPISDVSGTSAVLSIMAVDASRALSTALARRELRESEQRYGSVFEGSAVPILLIEPSTTQIVDANPAACNFYGYGREEFMSMSILQVDAIGADSLQAELRRAIEGNRGRFVGQHLTAGMSVRDVEINVGPIAVGGRSLLYAMVNDITERKRMEAELESSRRNLERTVAQRTEDLLRANAELQQASMARDMVLVSLAREMRTSLQTIGGFSDLLLGGMAGELTDEQRRQMEMIGQAGRQLASFASSLMETRRADEERMVSVAEEFDLVSLAESVLFGLVSFADDKGLKLTLVAEERPVQLTTDRYMLQQVVLNLLSNAIRYTDRGGVTVTISQTEDECVVAVADTGAGLTSEQLEGIFEGPDVRIATTGIGLPASHRIASRLGGTIDVQSILGRGSVFILRVPRQLQEASAVDAGEDRSGRSSS